MLLVERGAHERDLERVPLGVVDHRIIPRIHVTDHRRIATPVRGMNVLTAGDDHAGQPVAQRLRVGVVGQVHRNPTGPGDPLREVGHEGVGEQVTVALVQPVDQPQPDPSAGDADHRPDRARRRVPAAHGNSKYRADSHSESSANGSPPVVWNCIHSQRRVPTQ